PSQPAEGLRRSDLKVVAHTKLDESPPLNRVDHAIARSQHRGATGHGRRVRQIVQIDTGCQNVRARGERLSEADVELMEVRQPSRAPGLDSNARAALRQRNG